MYRDKNFYLRELVSYYALSSIVSCRILKALRLPPLKFFGCYSLYLADFWSKKWRSLWLRAITGFCFWLFIKFYLMSSQAERVARALLALRCMMGILNPFFWGYGLKVASNWGVAGRSLVSTLMLLLRIAALLVFMLFSLFQSRNYYIYSLFFKISHRHNSTFLFSRIILFFDRTSFYKFYDVTVRRQWYLDSADNKMSIFNHRNGGIAVA